MEIINERVEIIDSFTSNYPNRSYATQKGKGSFSFLFYIYPILAVVLIGIVLWSFLGELIGHKSRFNLNKASISILFSISILINAFRTIYASILLKHLDYLINSRPKNLDENSNKQLATIIAAYHKPLGPNLYIASLVIIILIAVVTNFFMDKQFVYYKFLIAPTLLFYTLTILDGIKTYKKLSANINEIENSQPQHQLI